MNTIVTVDYPGEGVLGVWSYRVPLHRVNTKQGPIYVPKTQNANVSYLARCAKIGHEWRFGKLSSVFQFASFDCQERKPKQCHEGTKTSAASEQWKGGSKPCSENLVEAQRRQERRQVKAACAFPHFQIGWDGIKSGR